MVWPSSLKTGRPAFAAALLLFLGSLFALTTVPEPRINSKIERTFTNENQLLEKIVNERQTRRDKVQSRDRFVRQILIHPRGASPNGRFVLFEKREFSDHATGSFILFDNKFATKSEYELPNTSKSEREAFLLQLPLLHNFITRADYIENTVGGVPVQDGDPSYLSPWGRRYIFETTLEAPSRIRLKVFFEFQGKRKIIADYSVVDQVLGTPRVTEVFPFQDYFGFGVKLGYRRPAPGGQEEWIEEVLCFWEDRFGKSDDWVVTREKAFRLDESQKKTVFLTHFTYDMEKNLKRKGVFFLGGDQKTERYP